MAQAMIAPIIPNIGLQGEAIAGSSAVIFTAADRQVIKERAGEVDKTRSFKDLILRRDFTSKVENEQTSIQQEQDLKSLENRREVHNKMLKHSPVTAPREQVLLSGESQIENPLPPIITQGSPPVKEDEPKVEINKKDGINKETAAIAKELNINPTDLFDKLGLEQDELHALVHKIKELHLKRLLCANQKEFGELTEAIKKETLASGRHEARAWLETQLDQLTQFAAEYKTKLSEALKEFQ